MKKLFCMILAVGVLFLAACESGKEEKPEETKLPTEVASAILPIEEEVRLSFSRDMGTSFTDLVIRPDGTFRGNFSNSNPGEGGVGAEGTEYAGWEYESTDYLCDFAGRFINIEKKSAYAYAVTLSDIQTEEPVGKEWISDGQFGERYVVVAPPGMENGDTLLLYTPDAPLTELPEDFLYGWPGNESESGILGMYGIYNAKTGQGYFEAESGEGE